MPHPKIRLALRVVIDANSTAAWDTYIFEDTYREYLIKQQLFNSADAPVTTFRELLSVNPKAEQLHFLTGMAADSYVAQLKGSYHRVTDVLSNTFFPFTGYRLDIVNTDTTNIAKHKVGITLFSPLFTFFGIVNNSYMVSLNSTDQSGYETIMFPLQPQLALCYYEGSTINNLANPQLP